MKKTNKLIIQERKMILNQLVKELNKNLGLIGDYEDINSEKVYQIKTLREEILAVEPNFKDDFEIALENAYTINPTD